MNVVDSRGNAGPEDTLERSTLTPVLSDRPPSYSEAVLLSSDVPPGSPPEYHELLLIGAIGAGVPGSGSHIGSDSSIVRDIELSEEEDITSSRGCVAVIFVTCVLLLTLLAVVLCTMLYIRRS